MLFVLLLLFTGICFADALDIRILRVEFLLEEPNNSLTTGRGTFCSDPKKYKLDDPCSATSSRADEAYWQSHIKFAENYFDRASGGKVSINVKVFPKNQKAYKLQKYIIDYNRTSRYKGEKMEAFDSARAADYARFVEDVLNLAKEDPDGPLAPSGPLEKRVILIAHAGANRLIDGGTLGTRGANTPGDFMDAYIDTTWGEKFWKGFEVSPGDTVKSVMVTSETASQDGLNWGINGTITSQIGRELGLPYSFDVVKGFSRLGYFDGMDFAGYNAGNGFFPVLPSAWMMNYKGWAKVEEVLPSRDIVSIEICAVGYNCSGATQIVKIPINHNEYILLENRQRTNRADGKISVKMSHGKIIEIPVDSLSFRFLDAATQETGVIESIEEIDAAIPASGIVAWHVNQWYIDSLISYGAINAWNGEIYKDHQFGISLIEADGVLGLGKEFKNSAGESVFYFGSGSDLIPHKRFNSQRQLDTVLSLNPTGYANTASTFGGYSGIKITAKIPPGAKPEKTFNAFTGDSVINWRALKIPVEIEWIGKYARPISKKEWPYTPTEEDFAEYQKSELGYFSLEQFKKFNTKGEDFLPIYADINNDGVEETIFLGNNRLYVVDSNGVPLPNFPVLLSNGEPLSNFRSKPLAIDITGNDTLEILIPANNGLLLVVNNKGKLLKGEFPIAAGTFVYEDTITREKFPMLLYKFSKLSESGNKDSIFLFTMHRGTVNAFYLPSAKEFYISNIKNEAPKDEISEFFIFPNPIRGGKATMRFRILAPASSASLEVFDITGFKVFNRDISSVNHGSNQVDLNFSKLGSDIYSARLTVKFASGKKKEKWVKIGVTKR
jgi:M6 family metalloprotease-like protein